MDSYDCTRIVYSSSATVYGTPPTIPIPETTRLKADSPYGKSKVMSEQIIDDLCHGKLLLSSFPLEIELMGKCSGPQEMECTLASLLQVSLYIGHDALDSADL